MNNREREKLPRSLHSCLDAVDTSGRMAVIQSCSIKEASIHHCAKCNIPPYVYIDLEPSITRFRARYTYKIQCDRCKTGSQSTEFTNTIHEWNSNGYKLSVRGDYLAKRDDYVARKEREEEERLKATMQQDAMMDRAMMDNTRRYGSPSYQSSLSEAERMMRLDHLQKPGGTYRKAPEGKMVSHDGRMKTMQDWGFDPCHKCGDMPETDKDGGYLNVACCGVRLADRNNHLLELRDNWNANNKRKKITRATGILAQVEQSDKKHENSNKKHKDSNRMVDLKKPRLLVDRGIEPIKEEIVSI